MPKRNHHRPNIATVAQPEKPQLHYTSPQTTMLPQAHKLAFLVFALITLAFGARGFLRLARRIRRGRPDTDLRLNNLPRRIVYALITTLTQSRTFRKRPWISFFHSLIFYGFVFYLLVNLVDAVDGFHELSLHSLGLGGQLYVLAADLLSAGVLVGVLALVLRRFALPSRDDFRFNERTLLHEDVRAHRITRDSILVSAFILFHVGSRAIGAAAKLKIEGPDKFAPFATLLSHAITPQHAEALRIFGYWGALGSVLAFLAYFPYTKHIHIFAAPAKYLVARNANSGTLPFLDLNPEAPDESTATNPGAPHLEEMWVSKSPQELTDDPNFGAAHLENLAWPRLLDAYACIQCNRCQDVCPATATGKSLSPSALEINKRMELNLLAATQPSFETGARSPRPLLAFALSVEAAWGCTTCGACMEVCPVQDEPMLDIIDVRRQQVMMEGAFPAQLQTAFRGMERAQNPWGTNPEKRLDWAAGLGVKTVAENPTPDVLYWVGCAAATDPQSQKTARAFVQLMQHAGVDFAVLGKQECCTGDSARRAGNEPLFQQLATQNTATLNAVRPKKIVATCPHCFNAIGNEYKQFGGDFTVEHHTTFLASLAAEGKLTPTSPQLSSSRPEPDSLTVGRSGETPVFRSNQQEPGAPHLDSEMWVPTESSGRHKPQTTIAFHDPCYLGRHNSIYDAPRNLLNILTPDVIELPRNRENSFCCGAGGAQFWKEEEPGDERISDNRYREAATALAARPGEEKVLAVGCPFCKSMLESTPTKGEADIQVRDIAELLLERVQGKPVPSPEVPPHKSEPAINPGAPHLEEMGVPTIAPGASTVPAEPVAHAVPVAPEAAAPPPTPRKKWAPRASSLTAEAIASPSSSESASALPLPAETEATQSPAPPARKKWAPKATASTEATAPPSSSEEPLTPPPPDEPQIPEFPTTAPARKKWTPKKP